MWELDHKEELMFSILSILSFNWSPKNWCFQIVGLEKTLESPLDCKDIKPVNPKGNQYWIFIGRTDTKAETPILWPPHAKNRLTGKDWRQEEKGTTEDEMVGWHHQLNGHEFEPASGVGDGQGSLACYSPWGHKELDMTEQLNWFHHNLANKKCCHIFFNFVPPLQLRKACLWAIFYVFCMSFSPFF